MTTKTKFSESDPKLSMMIERRGLSKGAIKNYNTVFREIYELFGVSPSELIKKAKREQKPFKNPDGTIEVIELEDRTVTEYQFKYYNFLKDKNLSNKTIKLKLDTFRALLGEYNIQKPKAIQIVIKNDRIRDGDIVSWREVEKAMSFCKGIRDKAIISFIATTGLRSSDVVKLSIADLIKACSIYFDENEEKTIDKLLSKNADDIIPCWEIIPSKTSKKSQLCVTFNTPEATEYLWQYLKERITKDTKKGGDGIIKSEEPLFSTSRKNRLTSDAVGKLFQRLNKRLGGQVDKNEKYGRFRSHSLRKLFSTTCRRNLTQVVINSDKTSEIDIISIFTGHVPPNESNSKVYEAIESDSHDSYLRKTYTALIPYLSIQNIEVKDIKTQQFKDLEEQNNVLQEQLKLQGASMQREMDEQKEIYEKKIRNLESVNSALSTQVKGIQNQIDNIANVNDLTRIQEYLSNHDLVEKYNLTSDVINLYKEDVKKDDFEGVTNSYIEELIYIAYNRKVAYERGYEEIYNDDLWKIINQEIGLYEQNIMWDFEFKLSSSQKDKIAKELDKYAKELWKNNQNKVNEDKVRGIVEIIATKSAT